MSESLSALQAQLFSQAEANVFAVLDGASIPDLLAKFDQYQPEYCCLYRGELPTDLAAAAPYLVRLEPGSELMKWLLSVGLGQHWGIFAVAKANLRTMRQHFRRLLTVALPEGKTVYFRFYDPRVLRTFLPTCSREEQQVLFGPVMWYWIENEGESLYKTTCWTSYRQSNLRNLMNDRNVGIYMLVIRKEQINILSQYMLKCFHDSMERCLKSRYPEQTEKMGNKELRELVVEGVEQAKEYGITDESDVKRFIEYLVMYTRNFGKSPETMWAEQFLNDKNLAGTEKMNQIDDYDLFVVTLGK